MTERMTLSISGAIATSCEFAAVVAIVLGASQAIVSVAATLVRSKALVAPLAVSRGFAGWLVLALEFLLAADILRTAVSPTWNDIGRLAAIAAIRTFLNYSLSHDLHAEDDLRSSKRKCLHTHNSGALDSCSWMLPTSLARI